MLTNIAVPLWAIALHGSHLQQVYSCPIHLRLSGDACLNSQRYLLFLSLVEVCLLYIPKECELSISLAQ